MGSFTKEYLMLRKKRLEEKENKTDAENIEIAPVKEDTKRTWFSSGALADGYQFGDILKTSVETERDLRQNLLSGILGMGEAAVDAGAGIVGGVGRLFGQDDFADKMDDFVASDLYDEDAVAKTIINPYGKESNLLLGEKSESLTQSAGQLLGTVALQAAGVPWFVTTGVTSYGSGLEGALNDGASGGAAQASALVSMGADILTEKLFGGSGLGEKGLIDTSAITKAISNKAVKALADYGVDVLSEGAEEVAASFIQNLGSALYKEENLSDILFSEDAIDEYIESFVGGAALGGIMNVPKVAGAVGSGTDYHTGLTANDQKVFDKVYEEAIKEAQAEKGDKKLTAGEKAKIEEAVRNSLDKGYISTDTIEEVLGGESYAAYKDAVQSEEAIIKEYETLIGTKESEFTVGQRERLNELKEQIDDAKKHTNSDQIKSALSEGVSALVGNSRLLESYNERARSGKRFTADLGKVDKKYRATYQKAMDSGVVNNTGRAHEFVELVAKISADRGVSFDFTNNEKLKESGFAIGNVTVNGYVTKDGITINTNSAKALNSVVGHEITHVLEGTELYTELQKAVKAYAETKGEYGTRYDALAKLYAGVKDANIDAELTADLVGDYLFTDVDFVSHLSTKNRNVFQKIYDEIKYLCKLATAGSKEARALERVKKAFDKAYRESGSAVEGTKFSLVGKNAEGIEVYETSQEVMDLTWSERKARYLDIMKNEYQGRTAKFTRNGHTYYAKFDQKSVRKPIYGDSRSSSDGIKALINAGADGDVFDLVENSQYTRSKPNTKNHTNADYFDYFVKTVQIDGKVFDLVADVEKQNGADGGYVYTLALRDNKKIEASPAHGTPEMGPVKSAGNASNESISQNDADVNTKFSLSDSDIAPVKGRGFHIYGDDVRFDAPIREDIAPVAEGTDAEVIAPIREDIKPVTEESTIASSFGISKINDPVSVQKNVFETLVKEGFFNENNIRMVENQGSGMKVEINESGIQEAFSFKNFGKLRREIKDAKLATIRMLPEIIETGTLTQDNVSNYHNKNSNIQYAYIEKEVNVNGKDMTVEVAVRKSLQKNKFWMHKITIKNSNGSIPAGISENSKTGYRTSVADGDIVSQNADEVKDFSKVSADEVIAPIREDVASVREDIAPVGESSIKTTEDRLAAKIKALEAEISNNQKLREQSKAKYDSEIAALQAKYDAKKNKNSKAANDILRRVEQLRRMQSSVDADYAKRISDLEERATKMNTPEYKTAAQRKAKHEEYFKQMEALVGDTSTWKDKSWGLQYETNTLHRNLRYVVRDAEGKRDIAKADAIYDELQGKYNQHEAEMHRDARRIKAPFVGMEITSAEDTYIQMLGEFEGNPETTLTKEDVDAFYEKHKGKIDVAKVKKAIAAARTTYDSLLERLNEVLREQGMREIPYRKGYFPHFTDTKQNLFQKIINWKTQDFDLPTDIAGLTESFNPERSWQSFNKQRKGDTTDYSFTKGFDTYVRGALDWIYHIEDIQKRRAFENYIRYIHSNEGVQKRIAEIQANDSYDADEAQKQMDLVMAEAENPLPGFVIDLRTGTNTLAGKKSSMDRGAEQKTNRKIYSVMTNISNRVSGNLVGASISSAITNFIPITQSWGEVSPLYSALAALDTLKSVIKDDGMIERSDFLTNRLRIAENLYKSTWDKISDKAGILFSVIDNFTSQVVWRSKYRQNIKKKMSENAAIKNADKFAARVMASRSRGDMPTIFDSKSPIVKIFTAFQLEVNNSYGYMFQDMPQNIKGKTKARTIGKLVTGYATMFLGAYVYNALSSMITGRDAAFDPLGIMQDLLQDIFGAGDEEEKEPADIFIDFASDVVDEVPFIGGLMGGGRIPISSMIPYGNVWDMVTGTVTDSSKIDLTWEKLQENGLWKSLKEDEGVRNLTKEWLNPIYYLVSPMGGGQIRKTVEGLSMFKDSHPVAGSYTTDGNLRFPVEETLGEKIRAGIFGQYASGNARRYFDEGRSPLNEKQTQELIDSGWTIEEYWDYQDNMKRIAKRIEEGTASDDEILTYKYMKSEDADFANYGKVEYDEFLGVRYANIGDAYYDWYTPSEDAEDRTPRWRRLDDDQVTKYKATSAAPEGSYHAGSGEDQYRWYIPSEDAEDPTPYWKKLTEGEREKQALYTRALGCEPSDYWQYSSALNGIRSDKDEDGKTIQGSRKDKVIEYLNALDADYGEKIILFKSEYNGDDTYNYDIIEYLNGREDISYEEMEQILTELGFTVDEKGNIAWD